MGLAHDFHHGIPRHFGELGVDVFEMPRPVGDGHAGRALLDGEGEFVQRLLIPLALGDVHFDRQVFNDPALIILDGRNVGAFPKFLPVLFSIQQFAIPLPPAIEGLPHFNIHLGIGLPGFQKAGIGPQRFIDRITGVFAKAGIDKFNPTRQVRDHHGGRALLDGLGELAERAFHPLALGDVHKGSHHRVGPLAIALEQGLGIDADPFPQAVRKFQGHDHARARLSCAQAHHRRMILPGERLTVLAHGMPAGIRRSPTGHLGETQAQDFFGAGIATDNGARRILNDHALRQGAQNRLQPLLDLQPLEDRLHFHHQCAD